MINVKYLEVLVRYYKNKLNYTWIFAARKIHSCVTRTCAHKTQKDVIIKMDFEKVDEKSKNTYLDVVKIFLHKNIHRRGHVEFIYSALKCMKDYGVYKDLEVYKALVDVLPKGKFIPQNLIQTEFMHYPKQQQCAIDLLEQMEDNGVLPDQEMEEMLLNVFGNRGYPLRKFWRMMYWMPKFKNLSPWPVPNPLPNDSFDLAKLAISRICRIDIQTKIAVYQTADISNEIEDTWIVSGQAPIQKMLLVKHKKEEPVFVEGPFRIWLRDKAVSYFILRSDPKPPTPEIIQDPDDVSKIKIPIFNFGIFKKKDIDEIISVHEQNDGNILGVCATGTSSKNSLLAWIYHLVKDGNSSLGEMSVVFSLKTAEKEITVSDMEDQKLQIEN